MSNRLSLHDSKAKAEACGMASGNKYTVYERRDHNKMAAWHTARGIAEEAAWHTAREVERDHGEISFDCSAWDSVWEHRWEAETKAQWDALWADTGIGVWVCEQGEPL